MDHDMMNLALMSTQEDMLDIARYFFDFTITRLFYKNITYNNNNNNNNNEFISSTSIVYNGSSS